MLMRLTSPPKNHPLTSTRRRPVKVMKAQERSSIEREGKKPARPVRMGSASMPAPIQLPATRSIPPKILPAEAELLHFIVALLASLPDEFQHLICPVRIH